MKNGISHIAHQPSAIIYLKHYPIFPDNYKKVLDNYTKKHRRVLRRCPILMRHTCHTSFWKTYVNETPLLVVPSQVILSPLMET